MTTNTVNGKKYIGRHKATEFEGTKYLGSGKILYQAIDKYGEENFVVEMLCSCDSDEELNRMEDYYIQKYNAQNDSNFYNIRRGGSRGPGGPMFKGHKHTEKTKQLMRESRKGSKNANYGNRWHQSDELKELHRKISSGSGNGMYGKHHSDETKRLIGMKNSIQRKGRKLVSCANDKKFVHPEDIQSYLDKGWILGKWKD
jgi:group I intron endonuclease